VKIKRKIAILLVGLFLWGCDGMNLMGTRPDFKTPQSLMDADMQSDVQTQTAVLLPLSGQHKALGEDLRNAAMMAGFERQNSRMNLLFFDTKGTPEGAREAYLKAKEQDPGLVLGPVFAPEVAAIVHMDPSVPVISFTSDHSVLSKGVYSMALLIPEQVSRIVQFACDTGKLRLGVLGPENKTGELVMNSLSGAIKACPGMQMTKISLYNPKTTNFDPVLMKIIPKPIDPKKEDLTEEEQILLATPMADRLEFDALFIFEEGVKLRQVVSLLSYYDVTPAIVPFYGLSNWQRVNDRGLRDAYFPAMPMDPYKSFEQKYEETFSKKPVEMAAFAYDGVALASFLAAHRAMNNATVTIPVGYYGANGRFRFNADGTNERLLGIYQIKSRQPLLVDSVSRDFPAEKSAAEQFSMKAWESERTQIKQRELEEEALRQSMQQLEALVITTAPQTPVVSIAEQ
jgi:hypothetical protein